MPVLEIYEVVVPRALFSKAREGDQSARDELGRQLNGIHLYLHPLPFDETTHTVVNLEELHKLNIVDSVVIECNVKCTEPT